MTDTPTPKDYARCEAALRGYTILPDGAFDRTGRPYFMPTPHDTVEGLFGENGWVELLGLAVVPLVAPETWTAWWLDPGHRVLHGDSPVAAAQAAVTAYVEKEMRDGAV